MRRIAPGRRNSIEWIACKFNKFARRAFDGGANSSLEVLFEHQIGHAGFSGDAHFFSDRKRCLYRHMTIR